MGGRAARDVGARRDVRTRRSRVLAAQSLRSGLSRGELASLRGGTRAGPPRSAVRRDARVPLSAERGASAPRARLLVIAVQARPGRVTRLAEGVGPGPGDLDLWAFSGKLSGTSWIH